jgi:hypothetical protein
VNSPSLSHPEHTIQETEDGQKKIMMEEEKVEKNKVKE